MIILIFEFNLKVKDLKSTDPPIVVDYNIDCTMEAAWESITVLEEMKKWYFENINAFEPVPGSTSRFKVVSGSRTFTHLWEVTEVVAFHKISYNWKYFEYPGDAMITFELTDYKEQVNVRISVDVLRDFPEDIPEFSRESCEQGWQYFIGERLKNHLEHRP